MNGDAPENGTFYSHFLLLNGYAPEKSPIVGLFVHFYRLLWTNGHQKGASLPLLGAGCTSGMLNGDAPEYVKTYTLFDNTKIPLQKWFIAIWLVTSHKKGISSIQLSKDIRVTQKTAWFMLQRIRNCFGYDNNSELNNNVEIDETFVGGKNKNRHKDKKVKNSQGRSFKDKTPVFGMLERNNKVVAKVVPDTKSSTLLPIIHKYINYDANVYTDDWFYGDIDKYYNREQVNHSIHYYGSGYIYTNTIEGFWSIMKRGIIGIYHFTSRKHLQLYVDEFVFRYNNRNNNENIKFNLLLCNNEYRLTYKELTNG